MMDEATASIAAQIAGSEALRQGAPSMRRVGWSVLVAGVVAALSLESWPIAVIAVAAWWGINAIARFYALLVIIEANSLATLAAMNHLRVVAEFWHDQALEKMGLKPPERS